MKKHLAILALALTFSGCASFPTASEVSATASKFANDALGYAETLAKAIQTVNTGIQASAPVFEAVATQWGLLPANSKQLAIFNTVVSDSAKVSADAAAVNALLTPAALTATVAAAPTSSTWTPQINYAKQTAYAY